VSNDLGVALRQLRAFLAPGGFARSGAVITDLDGTAVLEREGRIYLPPEVELGLKRVHDLGRPVIANTLRFPLSVIRVFGAEWHRATGTHLPLVSMKGSQIGRVVTSSSGETAFEEWHAETLGAAEIAEVLTGIEGVVADGADDLLVFSYPRDWTQGERIWTPDPRRVGAVRAKYRSASTVGSGEVAALREQLLAEPICMLFLLTDVPRDHLMAYQHTNRASFFTRTGVSKRTGAEAIARHLGIDLTESIGAGDASPDDFLAACGLAVIVGSNTLDYKGLRDTIRVEGIPALGQLLATVGDSLE
jgi:hypothetical protein